LEPAI
jgi:hypothetical protein